MNGETNPKNRKFDKGSADPGELLVSGDRAWSFLGFEPFDLLIVVCQFLFFVLAIPLDQFFLHPATKFFSSLGYVVTLYFLGRTRQYAEGYAKISGVHQYIFAATGLGGILSGIMVSIFVTLPVGEVTRQWHLDGNLVILAMLPFSIFAMFLVPYLASRVEEPSEDIEFITCPFWLHWLGRASILVLANTMLLYVYDMMQGESEDSLLSRSIICSFTMCVFYIPIRVQEMFLRPNGPHFQSLIQTTILLILFGNSPPFLK